MEGCTSMTKAFNVAGVGSLALQENKRRETGEGGARKEKEVGRKRRKRLHVLEPQDWSITESLMVRWGPSYSTLW